MPGTPATDKTKVTASNQFPLGNLAIIAGEGKLPAILAKAAREKGYKVHAFCLSEDARAQVEAHADHVGLFAPGQLGKNIKTLHHYGCDKIVFIGKIPKINFLRNLHKLDWVAVRELSQLPNFNDDTIQFRVGDLFEANGLHVITQSEFLRHLFPDVGVLTKRQPTAAEYADIEYGKQMAKELARLDIGQTVIVRDRMIIAVEAIEGTDEAIKRAVRLARGSVVVVKVSKPNQDQRFDIPAVGTNTLDAMKGDKPGGVLAIEANETLVVEQEEMAAYADKCGISIVAV